MSTTGLVTVVRIQWRVQWRRLLTYPIALGAAMAGTAAAVAGLYDTPAKIHSYASAVTGDALLAINGRVEGIDSLGGVIQDEFGFLAAFAVPLLGVAVVGRATRREEEDGRLDVVLSGRVARSMPTLGALLIAVLTILATSLLFAVGLAGQGVPADRATLYAASLGALALVFAASAAVLAQLTSHARGVLAGGLLLLALAFVLRGVGDVTGSWITWLSPLGWAERAAPFGAARWWTLLVPLLVSAVVACLAIVLASRRDVGSALVGSRSGPARASAVLRSPAGAAAWIHRPGLLGWSAAAVLLTGSLGALARQLIDAMAGNPALADAIGTSGPDPDAAFLSMTHLYLAIVATGFVVQAVGVLHAEESAGRLESRLAGTLSRRAWFTIHALVIVAGLVLMVLVASLVLALATAWSLGDGRLISRAALAGLAFLPAELVVGAAAMAVFALRPRASALVWAGYGAIVAVAFLGAGLRLPQWVRTLAPTEHVGTPPLGSLDTAGLVGLSAITLVLVVIAVGAFCRRDVPQV